MFETAVVRARVRGSRISLLSVSLAAHSAVILAVIAASLSSTRMPEQAPKMMIPVYLARPIVLPSALGTPGPPKAAASRRTPKGADVVSAPASIPDAIAVQPSAEPTPGLPTGTPGGIPTEAPTAVSPYAGGPLPIGNGVKSPVVLHRVDPIFPAVALRAHMGGTVVLECIIDKSGHVRDVRVARSTFAAFEQPAIDAVQNWLFAPGSLNGQAVDTIFELTVKFEVT